MSVQMFNNKITRMFYEEYFQSLINEYDLQELKQLKLLVGTDYTGRNEYEHIIGWVVGKNRYKYFLPEKIKYKGKQVDIIDVMPIKITDVEQFSYATTVYHRPTEGGIGVFKISPERTMTTKEWFDQFADFKHTNRRQFDLYKGIVLGALIFRFNFRIATQPAFGKDSVTAILRDILPIDVSAYTPQSAPKLRTVLEKRLLVIDEIVDISKDSMQLLEPVIRHAGDMRTVVENSSLSVSGMTKDSYDISNLSLGFTFNEFKDYKSSDAKKDKSHKYFDNVFTNATKQRFLPLHFSGELNVAQFTMFNYNEVYPKVKQDLVNWIKMAKWLIEGGAEELLNEKDWLVPDFYINDIKSNRLKEHYRIMMQLFKLISDTEQEFHEYCKDVLNAHFGYYNMLEGFK